MRGSVSRSRPLRSPPACPPTASAPRPPSRSAGATSRSTASTRCRQRFDVARLPYSLKVLLENVLRLEDGASVTRRRRRGDRHLGRQGRAESRDPLPARPRAACRTSPASPRVVDLAAMRDAMAELGGDPAKINPLVPRRPGHRPLGPGRRLRQRSAPSPSTPSASSSATASATRSCAGARRPSTTSASCRRRPASVHQVNLEYLAQVVFTRERDGGRRPTPTPSSAPTRTRR